MKLFGEAGGLLFVVGFDGPPVFDLVLHISQMFLHLTHSLLDKPALRLQKSAHLRGGGLREQGRAVATRRPSLVGSGRRPGVARHRRLITAK